MQLLEIGDKFCVKRGLSIEECDAIDEITGFVREMHEMQGSTFTCIAVVDVLGPRWIVDDTENYCWREEWIEKVKPRRRRIKSLFEKLFT